eukprot:3938951-Pyramimonas_sp.AAC.1
MASLRGCVGKYLVVKNWTPSAMWCSGHLLRGSRGCRSNTKIGNAMGASPMPAVPTDACCTLVASMSRRPISRRSTNSAWL